MEASIAFTQGVARVVSAKDLREIEPWQRAFLGQSKDHRFYEITNETLGPNFEHPGADSM